MARSLFVMIATCQRPSLLRRTLESLAACPKPGIYRGTIVVENGSKSGVEEIVRAFSQTLNARYLYVAESNKSAALNTALLGVNQQGALVFFTDDDVRLDPGALVAYAEASDGVDRGEFYGGPVKADYEGAPPPDALRKYLSPCVRGWALPVGRKTRFRKPKLLGANWAAFAEDLAALGGYDARFGPGSKSGATGQEASAQRRLLKQGVRGWYLPNALVWHFVPGDVCWSQWALRRIRRVGISYGSSQTRGWRMMPWLLVTLTVLAWAILRRRLPSRRPAAQRDYALAYTVSKWGGVLEGMGLSPRPRGFQSLLRRIANGLSAAMPPLPAFADRGLLGDR